MIIPRFSIEIYPAQDLYILEDTIEYVGATIRYDY